MTLPQSATVTNWDEYPGRLEAVEMVEIRPRVTGYIDSIHFQDGAEVKAGELLFVIDPRPYQAELEQAQAKRSEWPYFNLGVLAMKQGQPQEAIRWLREALTRRPTWSEAKVQLAMALGAAGQLEEAAGLLRDVLA